MNELIHQLGIDWRLLLSQGVNFLILLTALTFLIYRPLIKLLEERRKKIEFGLIGAEEAERRLKEIDVIKNEQLAATEKKSLEIIGKAEKKGQEKTVEIVKEAERKAAEVLSEAAKIAELKKQEELRHLAQKANAIIKEAIVKTVNLDPKAIDEKLIEEAVKAIKLS